MLHTFTRDHRVRFATTGVAMTLIHLGIFRLVSPFTLPEVANAVAFVLATQVNFLVSYHWTWAARRAAGRETLSRVLRRALLFNASVGVAFLSNAVAFALVHRLLGAPPTTSVLAATAVSASVAYLVSSRVVFVRTATAPRTASSLGPADPAPAS